MLSSVVAIHRLSNATVKLPLSPTELGQSELPPGAASPSSFTSILQKDPSDSSTCGRYQLETSTSTNLTSTCPSSCILTRCGLRNFRRAVPHRLRVDEISLNDQQPHHPSQDTPSSSRAKQASTGRLLLLTSTPFPSRRSQQQSCSKHLLSLR